MAWNPRVLVISGGGLKGIGYAGMLKALEEELDLSKIKVLCGSSIGSLICTGLLLGYTVDEITEDLRNLIKMMPEIFPLLFGRKVKEKMIPLLTSQFSISNGKRMDIELKNIFLKKGFNPEKLTFLDLRRITMKDLVISGSNLTTGKAEYFSYRTRPNMLVYQALRISSRIPFVLPVIRMDGSLYIDGDIFDSFPIKGAKKKIQRSAHRGDMIGLAMTQEDRSYQIDDLSDYFKRIIEVMITKYHRISYKKYQEYTMILLAPHGGGLKMTMKEMDKLFKDGYKKGREYMIKRGHFTQDQNYERQKRLSEDPDQPDKEEHQKIKLQPD